MIVDSSALLAIVFREPTYESIVATLRDANYAAIGAATAVETGIVLGSRLGSKRSALLPRMFQAFAIAIVPFDDIHWAEAIAAYERFGRGRHRARLNFGDCLTYAVARIAELPILCVGDDFTYTDIPTVAIAPADQD